LYQRKRKVKMINKKERKITSAPSSGAEEMEADGGTDAPGPVIARIKRRTVNVTATYVNAFFMASVHL
jgi:hypothetical protein